APHPARIRVHPPGAVLVHHLESGSRALGSVVQANGFLDRRRAFGPAVVQSTESVPSGSKRSCNGRAEFDQVRPGWCTRTTKRSTAVGRTPDGASTMLPNCRRGGKSSPASR